MLVLHPLLLLAGAVLRIVTTASLRLAAFGHYLGDRRHCEVAWTNTRFVDVKFL